MESAVNELLEDARDVLYWLRSSTRRYTPYVADRVSNILGDSLVKQWRWVPKELNPADWGTKWSDRSGSSELWWNGPSFIGEDSKSWPQCFMEEREPLEVRVLLTRYKATDTQSAIVPDPRRFSNWRTLVRACSLAKKFIEIMRKRSQAGELTEAEILSGQEEIFRDAQANLMGNKRTEKFLATLAPFQDAKGIWRMRWRTANSPHLPYDARFPVIIDDQHPATHLFIMHIGN